MNLREIKIIAKDKGIKPINMKKSEIIRAIQRAEGNSDCFDSTKAKECDQIRCLWREDCVGIQD
jgi:hypothetical protein